MANRLEGKKVAILAADGVERVELVEPRDAVEREGAATELLSLEAGEIQSVNHDSEHADMFPVDRAVSGS